MNGFVKQFKPLTPEILKEIQEAQHNTKDIFVLFLIGETIEDGIPCQKLELKNMGELLTSTEGYFCYRIPNNMLPVIMTAELYERYKNNEFELKLD